MCYACWAFGKKCATHAEHAVTKCLRILSMRKQNGYAGWACGKKLFYFCSSSQKIFFCAGSACTNSKISRVKTLKSVQKQNNLKFFYGKKLRESMQSKISHFGTFKETPIPIFWLCKLSNMLSVPCAVKLPAVHHFLTLPYSLPTCWECSVISFSAWSNNK